MPTEQSNNTGSADSNGANETLPKVEVNIKEKPKDVAPLLDFSNPEDLEKMIAPPTEASQLNDKNLNGGTNDNNKTTNPFADTTKQTIVTELGGNGPNDNQYTEKIDQSEYELYATIIVDVIDRILVAVLRWIAKDTSDANYVPSTRNINMIKKHLTTLLARSQKKYPLETLLILAIIGAYFTPAWKAWEHRQAVLKLEKEKKAIEDAKTEAEKTTVKKTSSSPMDMVKKVANQSASNSGLNTGHTKPIVKQQVIRETQETAVQKQQETPVQPKKTTRIDTTAMIKKTIENSQTAPPPRKITVPKRTVPVPTVPRKKPGGINK